MNFELVNDMINVESVDIAGSSDTDIIDTLSAGENAYIFSIVFNGGGTAGDVTIQRTEDDGTVVKKIEDDVHVASDTRVVLPTNESIAELNPWFTLYENEKLQVNESTGNAMKATIKWIKRY